METAISQVKQKLKFILAKNLDVNIDIADIDDHESLYEGGVGLDSITLVSFIVQIENSFGIHFTEDEMNPELFNTIDTLAQFIATTKLEGKVLAK
jgi:acyl carrier protein